MSTTPSASAPIATSGNKGGELRRALGRGGPAEDRLPGRRDANGIDVAPGDGMYSHPEYWSAFAVGA